MTACQHSGAEQPDGRRFCTRCGAELATPSVPHRGGSPYSQPPPRREPNLSPPNLRPARQRRWLLAALLAAIAAVSVTVGGLAYSHVHRASSGTGAVPIGTSPSSSSSLDLPSSTPAPSPSSRQTSTSAPSPSASTGPGNSTVAISSGAGHDPLATAAVRLLTRYVIAINNSDYAGWRSVFAPDYRTDFTSAVFGGYASTQDSHARITAISPSADGREEVQFTFTSTQNASDGPDGEACTVWRLRFYVERVGAEYLFGRPPSSYQAEYSPC